MRQCCRIALALILALSVLSPCAKVQKKKAAPLWLRQEHRAEEAAWQRGMEAPEPDPEEVELLAIAIYCEAGADSLSDGTRRMVGDVILNRVADGRYPDTVAAVLTQKAQYGRFHWTGVVWPARAQNAGEAHAVARAREIARSLLMGEHSELYAAGYIFQAEFRQGKDWIQSDGIWFGR